MSKNIKVGVKNNICEVTQVDAETEIKKTFFNLNLSHSLEENIINICKEFNIEPGNYSLKDTNENKYISNAAAEVKDGDVLTLNYSADYYLDTIFQSDEQGIRFSNKLKELCFDPVFIERMVMTNRHTILMEEFAKNDFDENNTTICLIAILHILQKNHVHDINEKCFAKIMDMVKNYADKLHENNIRYALSVLQKILFKKTDKFKLWKETILEKIAINDLIKLIEIYPQNSHLHYCVLLLVNSLVKCCKSKIQIKFLNDKKNLDLIYKFIIEPTDKMDPGMPHQLYIYQTHLLSKYQEQLTTSPELDHVQIERNSYINEEESGKHKDLRYSLASQTSESSDYTGRDLGRDTIIIEDDVKISLLTKKAMETFSRNLKNKDFFLEFKKEVESFNSNVYYASEQITRIISKHLNIGEEPRKNQKIYQPLVFLSSINFFFEFHSRAMWLFSQTKHEMNARIQSDYKKVFRVLNKKVQLILENQCRDIKSLKLSFSKVSYKTVMQRWQMEYDKKMMDNIKRNPCIQYLKEQFSEKNKEYLLQHRIRFMQQPSVFPKLVDKKWSGEFKLQLSSNQKELITSDSETVKTYLIEDITHILNGKVTQLVRNKIIKERESSLAFGLIFSNEINLNFLATDVNVATFWKDGLYLLTGHGNLSKDYYEKLEGLVEMDIMLQLIELQDVEIPMKPPPVPRLPHDLKPKVPPKPNTKNHRKLRRQLPLC